jgi:hypothetical protein
MAPSIRCKHGLKCTKDIRGNPIIQHDVLDQMEGYQDLAGEADFSATSIRMADENCKIVELLYFGESSGPLVNDDTLDPKYYASDSDCSDDEEGDSHLVMRLRAPFGSIKVKFGGQTVEEWEQLRVQCARLCMIHGEA